MGRKKIEIERIHDERLRRVTFKKRRLGLVKKAIQLSKLSDAKIALKVYYEEDASLIEYYSHDIKEFEMLKKYSKNVQEYSNFENKHYSLLEQLDECITKHGHINLPEFQDNQDLDNEFDGINVLQLFSLAQRKPEKKERETDVYDYESQVKKHQKISENLRDSLTTENKNLQALYESTKKELEQLQENQKHHLYQQRIQNGRVSLNNMNKQLSETTEESSVSVAPTCANTPESNKNRFPAEDATTPDALSQESLIPSKTASTAQSDMKSDQQKPDKNVTQPFPIQLQPQLIATNAPGKYLQFIPVIQNNQGLQLVSQSDILNTPQTPAKSNSAFSAYQTPRKANQVLLPNNINLSNSKGQNIYQHSVTGQYIIM